MQLFQVRGFGEMLSDTFAFLKESGGHFIKNYIVINLGFILISIISTIPLITLFFDFDAFEPKPIETVSESLFENSTLFVLYLIFIILFSLVYYIINASFTPIYLSLYRAHKGSTFTTADLIKAIKSQLPKLGKALLGYIALIIPVLIFAIITVTILACTVVGVLIPIIFITFVLTFTLYEYLRAPENRFWNSFNKAWSLSMFKFWHSLGTYAIIFICVLIIQMVMSNIVIGQPAPTEFTPNIEPNISDIISSQLGNISYLIINSSFSSLVGFFTNIPLLVCTGIIFYSLTGEKENIIESDDIDHIGHE